MRRVSLRLRLTAWYAGVLVGGGALVLAGAYLVVRHNLAAATEAVQTAVDVRPPGGQDPDPGGDLGGDALAVPGSPGRQGELVDAQAAANARALERTLLAFLLGFCGLVALALVGGWLAAGRALAPLRRVTAAAGALSPGRTAGRIGLQGPDDEIRELADAFDDMADRLTAAFDSQRRFVANAAHELRTPLTLMATEIDVALADGTADTDLSPGLPRRLRADVDSLSRLVEGLLALADADRGVQRTSSVDLAELAAETAQGARGVADPTVHLHLALRPARTVGDPHLLRSLVENLLENAARHNTDGGHVTVRTNTERDIAVLQVENTGPVVDHGDVDGLFRPFASTRPDRGSGLGLAIVQAVAAAHQGGVHAVPRRCGGLVVTVRLPADGRPAPTPAHG